MLSNNVYGYVDEITNELLNRNERMLEKWLDVQAATNDLVSKAETEGFVKVAV